MEIGLNKDRYNYNKYCIPERMRGAIERYIDHGISGGHFLDAVLSNDLKEACARADLENQQLLFNYVGFLYNEVPMNCWGSPEIVKEYKESIYNRYRGEDNE